MKKQGPEVFLAFVPALLDPLCGLADDDEAVQTFQSFDSNDEEAVRTLIRAVLVPYFVKRSSYWREHAKVALSYALATSAVDFQRVFESILPPFDPPEPARNLFLWLWQELFPSESFEFLDVEHVRENRDVHKANRG